MIFVYDLEVVFSRLSYMPFIKRLMSLNKHVPIRRDLLEGPILKCRVVQM